MNGVAEVVLEAVAWCRLHNAMVRFESNGTVTVRMNGASRRRPTFVEAVDAHRTAPTKPRCGIEGCRLPAGHDGLHRFS